jgi:hypothetical protein
LASGAVALPPGTAIGMTVGAEMAPAHPATRGTVRVGAAMACGVSTWRRRSRVGTRRGGGAEGGGRWHTHKRRSAACG